MHSNRTSTHCSFDHWSQWQPLWSHNTHRRPQISNKKKVKTDSMQRTVATISVVWRTLGLPIKKKKKSKYSYQQLGDDRLFVLCGGCCLQITHPECYSTTWVKSSADRRSKAVGRKQSLLPPGWFSVGKLGQFSAAPLNTETGSLFFDSCFLNQQLAGDLCATG